MTRRRIAGCVALPPAATTRRFYMPHMLGRRVHHPALDIAGRLSGAARYERGALWYEVDTTSGPYWFVARNLAFLGPVPIPHILGVLR